MILNKIKICEIRVSHLPINKLLTHQVNFLSPINLAIIPKFRKQFFFWYKREKKKAVNGAYKNSLSRIIAKTCFN